MDCSHRRLIVFLVLDSVRIYFYSSVVWIFGEDIMTDYNLFSKAPDGDLYTKWEDYKKSLKKDCLLEEAANPTTAPNLSSHLQPLRLKEKIRKHPGPGPPGVGGDFLDFLIFWVRHRFWGF